MSAPASAVGLTPRAAARIRRISVATVLVLAVSAAVLSFAGLRELALQAGFPPELAWMFPIIVDGLVLAGSLGVISAALAGVRTIYFWFLTLLGVFISIVGNVASASDDLLSQSVHAAPPLIFALSVEGLLKVYRHAVTHPDAAPSTSPPPPTVTSEVSDLRPPPAPAIQGVEATPNSDPTSDAQTNEAPYRSRAVKDGENPPVTPTRQKTTKTGAGTARERLAALLESDPGVSGAQAARELGIDPSHARRILRELRDSAGDENPREATDSGLTSTRTE